MQIFNLKYDHRTLIFEVRPWDILLLVTKPRPLSYWIREKSQSFPSRTWQSRLERFFLATKSKGMLQVMSCHGNGSRRNVEFDVEVSLIFIKWGTGNPHSRYLDPPNRSRINKIALSSCTIDNSAADIAF